MLPSLVDFSSAALACETNIKVQVQHADWTAAHGVGRWRRVFASNMGNRAKFCLSACMVASGSQQGHAWGGVNAASAMPVCPGAKSSKLQRIRL